ncbi:unnamed protein product [Merluccius merluccius]
MMPWWSRYSQGHLVWVTDVRCHLKSCFVRINSQVNSDDRSLETCTQGMMVLPHQHVVAAHAIPPHALTQLALDWLALDWLVEDTPNFDPAGVCVGSGELEM